MSLCAAETTVSVRDKITSIERKMSKCPQVELQIQHYFKNGMYAREMRVPKGTLISGKVHSTGTIGVMSQGSMRIWGEDGVMRTVGAPYTHVADPGYKRIGYALEEVVWVTIHRTASTDLAQIERDEFVAELGGVDMFDFTTGNLKPQHELDRQDFRTMLLEFRLSAETVRAESEYGEDRVDLDLTAYRTRLGPSDIAGMGVFAVGGFPQDVVIGPANTGGKRTQFGRYVNHSARPNARMAFDGVDILLVASAHINDGAEITVDYRNSVEVRKCLV